MKQSQLIVKNMIAVLSSQLIGLGLNAVITILVVRHLGAIGFGIYSFILAFVSVFQLIAEAGLSNILTREISVKKENLKYQLGVTKSLIWVLSIIVLLLIIMTINIIGSESEIKNAVYIMGLAVVATVHAMGYNSVFRAMEEMEYNAIGFTLHKILLFTLIIFVIHYRLGIIEIALSYLISNTFLWLFYYVIIVKKYHRPKIIFEFKSWRYLISESIPIGISNILRRSSWHIDILILSTIGTAVSVGVFSAPYRIIQSIYMVSQSYSIPLYPFFSRLAKESHEQLFNVFEKSLKFMYILSIPLVVISFTHSLTITSILFGPDFKDSSSALQILSFTIFFLFPSAQLLYLFSALGKQRLYAIASFVSFASNVILDFILISSLDFIGACIATLISEIVLFVMGIYYAKIIYKHFSFLRILMKPLISGIFMWIVLYQFKDSSLFLILSGTVLSLLVYVILIAIFKTVSKTEFDAIRDGLRFKKKFPASSIMKNGVPKQ